MDPSKQATIDSLPDEPIRPLPASEEDKPIRFVVDEAEGVKKSAVSRVLEGKATGRLSEEDLEALRNEILRRVGVTEKDGSVREPDLDDKEDLAKIAEKKDVWITKGEDASEAGIRRGILVGMDLADARSKFLLTEMLPLQKESLKINMELTRNLADEVVSVLPLVPLPIATPPLLGLLTGDKLPPVEDTFSVLRIYTSVLFWLKTSNDRAVFNRIRASFDWAFEQALKATFTKDIPREEMEKNLRRWHGLCTFIDESPFKDVEHLLSEVSEKRVAVAFKALRDDLYVVSADEGGWEPWKKEDRPTVEEVVPRCLDIRDNTIAKAQDAVAAFDRDASYETLLAALYAHSVAILNAYEGEILVLLTRCVDPVPMDPRYCSAFLTQLAIPDTAHVDESIVRQTARNRKILASVRKTVFPEMDPKLTRKEAIFPSRRELEQLLAFVGVLKTAFFDGTDDDKAEMREKMARGWMEERAKITGNNPVKQLRRAAKKKAKETPIEPPVGPSPENPVGVDRDRVAEHAIDKEPAPQEAPIPTPSLSEEPFDGIKLVEGAWDIVCSACYEPGNHEACTQDHIDGRDGLPPGRVHVVPVSMERKLGAIKHTNLGAWPRIVANRYRGGVDTHFISEESHEQKGQPNVFEDALKQVDVDGKPYIRAVKYGTLCVPCYEAGVRTACEHPVVDTPTRIHRGFPVKLEEEDTEKTSPREGSAAV
jgi:hypothetical protein